MDNSGASVPDRALVNDAPAGHHPSGFDPSRYDITACEGVAYVLPRYEGRVRWAKRIGRLGIGVSWRWTSFNIGFDWLKAGGLVAVGPFYVWFAHIEKMGAEIEKWDRARDSDAGSAGDAQRLHSEGAAARARQGIAKDTQP